MRRRRARAFKAAYPVQAYQGNQQPQYVYGQGQQGGGNNQYEMGQQQYQPPPPGCKCCLTVPCVSFHRGALTRLAATAVVVQTLVTAPIRTRVNLTRSTLHPRPRLLLPTATHHTMLLLRALRR